MCTQIWQRPKPKWGRGKASSWSWNSLLANGSIEEIDLHGFWQGTQTFSEPPNQVPKGVFWSFSKAAKAASERKMSGLLGATAVTFLKLRMSWAASRQPHPLYIEESQIPSYCSSAKLRGSARSRNESSPTLVKCLDNRIDETSFKRFFSPKKNQFL